LPPPQLCVNDRTGSGSTYMCPMEFGNLVPNSEVQYGKI
jgi:hypothetical protein